MGAMERITVELPQDLVERLRARVAAGDFPSESVAILEALLWVEDEGDPDPAIDAWLRGPVAAAYDAVSDGTAVVHSSDEARQRLGIARLA